MRYLDQVVFVQKKDAHYDPALGEEVSGEIVELDRLAHVSHPSIEQSQLVFGDLKSDNLVVLMKQPLKDSFDYILFDNKKYYYQTKKFTGNRQMFFLKGDVVDGSNSDRNRET